MKLFKKASFLTAIFALFLTFSAATSFAQVTGNEGEMQPETYTLEAQVVDWESGEALADAQVMVVGHADLNTMTNAEGMFTLENLEKGTYTVKVKLDGYQTWKQEVKVTADKEIKVKLKPEIK